MTTVTTGDEMERRLREDDIDHVLVEFPDINGLSRSKVLSAEKFLASWEAGPSMNLAVLVQTPRNDLPTGTGLAEETGFADGRLDIEPQTFRVLPWRERTARVLGDITYRGEPVAASPRTVLDRVLTDIADLGLAFGVGSELECSLLESGGAYGEYTPVTDHKHECISWATEEVLPFYEQLTEWADAYGVPLDSIQHEHGPGQLEMLFKHGGPQIQADRTFDFKRLVKQTARRTDRYATFMAKPFTDESGNGYHLHVSARDPDTGANAFAEGDELTARGRHFVGGLLEHADALVALGTPTLNGFKRYDPQGFVPTTASWGYDHRQVGVRIPAIGTTRIESRFSAGDANPYLVIAATLAAGAHGIEAELDPGPPSDTDSIDDQPRLPRTQGEALAALTADDELIERLGEEVVSAYVAVKRRELQAFQATVTPWEREQYVEML
ncbi:MAG: glutamine synthetase family protein [Halobacteriales archaeon]